MEADKKPTEGAAPATTAAPTAAAPPDALEKTNEELEETAKADSAASSTESTPPDGKPPKKLNPLKAFFKRFNVYLLLFVLLVVIAAVFSVVSYLNSKKEPKTPTLTTTNLTQDALKQLASSDASVGGGGQTLTVQGNAIFSGQVLVQKDLNVAGTIKLGSELSIPKLTVSGATNLADTQINSLQVATGSVFQGNVTIQHDLNVAGTTSFSGPVTAGQITVSKLILSGNAQLQVPTHVAFTGASPGRSINAGVLGAGGSASVNGSDTSGTVSINTGNGPAAGCFTTMTFNKAFAAAPHVVVTPINAGAGLLQWYVTRTNTTFSICTNNTPPANQVFSFDYFITA